MEEEKNVELEEVKDTDSKKKKWWKYALIALALLLIIILIIVILKFLGNDSKKYKIKIHYGDDVVEVDSDFKLSDLEVDGGKVSFLVDSDGHIIGPDEKLDPKKEYSAHIIHEGKETVKVTYINGDWKLTVEYEKGAGLLFPADPVKEGYVFIGWKDLEIDDYPIFMMPVMKDMTVHAQFEKSVSEGGKCTLNCDTNNDGKCDLNCDLDGDGKPDKNIDKDGDGKCDLNCDVNNDGKCDYKCDTDGDGTCDLKCDEEIVVVSDNYDVTIGCTTKLTYQMTKNGELTSATVDGKEVEPDEILDVPESNYKWPTWDLKEFKEKGEPIELIIKGFDVDGTGQKYYYIYTHKISFIGNCKEPEPEPSPSPSATPDDDPEYTCQKGYTLKGTKCIKTTKETIDANVTYECESGYNESGDKCIKNVDPVCPSGFEEYGGACVYLREMGYTYDCQSTVPGTLLTYDYQNGKCVDSEGNPHDEVVPIRICPGQEINGKCGNIANRTTKDCPSGSTRKNDPTTFTCEIVKDKTAKYSCKDGYNLEGTKCTRTVTDTKNAMKVN